MPNMLQQLFLMNSDDILKDYAVYRAFNKSDSVINMRIPGAVADKLKQLAAAKGVPYQTLITATLFSLVNDEDKNKKK
ncbi:MAG: BrnA antitoxin family protein [Rickettsiales bacterium]|jgi:predicted DNA binding CopG/RHH family protein|nr:BrnA antitoxin family protein [Rickettsiales bacterium]